MHPAPRLEVREARETPERAAKAVSLPRHRMGERALEPEVVESRDHGDPACGGDLDQVRAQEEKVLDVNHVRPRLGQKLVEGLVHAPIPQAEQWVATAAPEGKEAHPLAAFGARPGDRLGTARRAEDEDLVSPPFQLAGESGCLELAASLSERGKSVNDEKDSHAPNRAARTRGPSSPRSC